MQKHKVFQVMRPARFNGSCPKLRLDADLDLSEAMVRMISWGEQHALVVREGQVQGRASLNDMLCMLGLDRGGGQGEER